MQTQTLSSSRKKEIKNYFSNPHKDCPKLINPTPNKTKTNHKFSIIKEEDIEESKEFKPKEPRYNNIYIAKSMSVGKNPVCRLTNCVSLPNNNDSTLLKKEIQISENRLNINNINSKQINRTKNNKKRACTPKSNLLVKNISNLYNKEKKGYCKTSNNFYQSKKRINEVNNIDNENTKINKNIKNLSYNKKNIRIINKNNWSGKKTFRRNNLEQIHDEIEKGINRIFDYLTKNNDTFPEINNQFNILIKNIEDIERSLYKTKNNSKN